MRNSLLILLLAFTCFASASIKDPRKNVKLSPELSQEQVAKHQALQRGQGQIGSAPEKTDDSGYLPRVENDADAAALIASHDNPGVEAEQVLQKNGEEIKSEKVKPKK